MTDICISTILGNKTRRRMLRLLKEQEMAEEEFQKKIGLPDFTFRIQMDYLRAGGLVEDEKGKIRLSELGKKHLEQLKEG